MFLRDRYSDTTFVIERVRSIITEASMMLSKSRNRGMDTRGGRYWRGLVVDDAQEFRKSAGMALSAMGGQITTAAHGAEAVAIVRMAAQCGLAFDIVFTDIQMPVMNGIEATRLIRTGGFGGPIIALSGSPEPCIEDLCLLAGCNQFIRKPASFETLARTVSQYLPTPLARDSLSMISN
jgi:CheY-like chemotaxis protein